MTQDEWNKAFNDHELTDISAELDESFLVFGQIFRAKVIYKGKKYYASAWKPSGSKPYVDLKEVE